MLSYMGIMEGIAGSKHKDDKNKSSLSSSNSTQNLQARVKTLLKEAGNKTCAECRTNKPKWMSIIETPMSQDQRKIGVFVCNGCFHFHSDLGEDLCELKSLKEPETCKLGC